MKPLSDRRDSQGNVRRSPAYCICKRRALRRSPDSQVDKLSVAAGQTVDDLPEGIRSRKMTKEHRNVGMTLRFMFGDQFFKVRGGKDLRKDLTEETRYLYHHDASVFLGCCCVGRHDDIPESGGFFIPSKSYFGQEWIAGFLSILCCSRSRERFPSLIGRSRA